MVNSVKEHDASNFGGDWTDRKLLALSKYLSAYTTALKKQRFSLVYIDAFAGAGRMNVQFNQGHTSSITGLKQESDEDAQYRHGSPLKALETEPAFDKFIFIDNNRQSLRRLKNQINATVHASKFIQYKYGDANKVLGRICCQLDWKSHRAVVFVDPFATEFDWSTIEKLAKTESVDLWLLFPAMAVNRMLSRTGKISEQLKRKLTKCFGTDEWKKRFYERTSQSDMFSDIESSEKIADFFPKLSQYVQSRLKTIFPGVSKSNLILKNSRESPLFLLCFACANPNPSAHRLAIKIANDIIKTSS